MVQRVRLVSVQSDWTLETLKAHLESNIEAQDKRLTSDIRHAMETAANAQINAQRAIDKADAATNKRFESFNEFNERMNKVTADSLPRETFDQFKEQYTFEQQTKEKRFVEIERRLSETAGEKSGVKDTKQASITTIALIVAAVGALSGVLGSVLATIMRPMGHI